nr:T9SS type A sorting domain-containing protein [Hymenobacter citatus]
MFVAGYSRPAAAQFPRQVSFSTSSASGFRVGGSATLTSTNANGTDGVLRLTSNVADQAGFAIDDSKFPAPSGFSISFEFFSYGGTGADGFSVFLIDADKTTAAAFTSGASGGSLGYAQKSIAPVSKGVPNGYIGIGLDEFGNFSNPTEGRVGGPGSVQDAVVIRGSGLGQDAASTTDYPYLAGSGRLPYSLDVNTTTRVTDPNDANYRRAYIDVVPQSDGTYKIKVRIQHGLIVETAINNITVPVPPANLRIGFAGSTGGSTNFHEIRNLSILQAPIANDDRVATKYGQPITFSAIANDAFFSYSNYNPGGVDLNPSVAGIQNTYTVNGQGTFTVTNDGQVTFTPVSTFSGIVTIPYTVQDGAGASATPAYSSNPANITVVVTGADVATTISGPSSVNPGSTTSYAVTATNNGQEAAIDLIPTLTLPANVTYVSGGSYNATTRVVSFPQTTLNSGESVTNNVVVTMPTTTGNQTFTSNYTYPTGAAIPDAVSTNNSSTLTVATTGAGNVAGVCSVPGKDGPATLTSTTVPNTYYAGSGTATAGNKFLTVSTTPTGSATPITAGDLLLILQTQGAQMTTANDATFGDVNNITAGTYEYAVAASEVNATTGQLDLAGALQNTYTTSTTTTNSQTTAYQTFQVIRIPQYSALTISGTVTGAVWNGNTGGVLALEVAGATNFTNSGSLNMDGKGFRGGAARTSTSNGSATVYRSTGNGYGTKGESIAGLPVATYDGSASNPANPSYNIFAVGSNSFGKAANGGGGGVRVNSNHSGGGGGSNGGAGGAGQSYAVSGITYPGGIAGVINGASTSRLYLGGGGGSGTTTSTTSILPSSGQVGGGIILLRTGVVSNAGNISANGFNAANTSGTNTSAGGGGAGGTVVVRGNATLNQLTITATGGNGGAATNTTTNATNILGYGGGGGGGVILSNAAVGTSSSVAGGAYNGGNTGTGAAGITNTSTALGTDCMPSLRVALSTTTPQVNRSAAMQAAYVLVVSNTGGGVTGASVTATMNSLFTYTNTAGTTKAELVLADGTTLPVANSDYSVNTTTANSPVFSGLNIPSGASLRISFLAAVASSAVNGTAYQASGNTTYLDPTRTTASRTVGPGSAMATGANAPGSNYASASSTREDVTITQPLPVELKQFNVAAVRQDAQLTWSTASEKNNDRFEVERSLDGEVFERIGTVKGAGYSTQVKTYHYFDANAARLSAGHPLYYRLRQVDTDGTDAYSPVRAIQFAAALETTVSVYPNPTHTQATLELTSLPAGNYQVRILDMTGRVLREQTLAGKQLHQLSVADLPMGTYLVQVRGANTSLTLPLLRN